MTTVKIANYTPTQTTELVTAYRAATSQGERANVVKTFAQKFGKKDRSIVAKLSREGVYVKPVRLTKTGAAICKKESLVDLIAAEMSVDSEKLESLSKATKSALQMVLTALRVAAEMLANDFSDDEETSDDVNQATVDLMIEAIADNQAAVDLMTETVVNEPFDDVILPVDEYPDTEQVI